MTMKFENYGNLEWLSAREFCVKGWRSIDADKAEDGELYDIVQNRSGEIRFVTI